MAGSEEEKEKAVARRVLLRLPAHGNALGWRVAHLCASTACCSPCDMLRQVDGLVAMQTIMVGRTPDAELASLDDGGSAGHMLWPPFGLGTRVAKDTGHFLNAYNIARWKEVGELPDQVYNSDAMMRAVFDDVASHGGARYCEFLRKTRPAVTDRRPGGAAAPDPVTDTTYWPLPNAKGGGNAFGVGPWAAFTAFASFEPGHVGRGLLLNSPSTTFGRGLQAIHELMGVLGIRDQHRARCPTGVDATASATVMSAGENLRDTVDILGDSNAEYRAFQLLTTRYVWFTCVATRRKMCLTCCAIACDGRNGISYEALLLVLALVTECGNYTRRPYLDRRPGTAANMDRTRMAAVIVSAILHVLLPSARGDGGEDGMVCLLAGRYTKLWPDTAAITRCIDHSEKRGTHALVALDNILGTVALHTTAESVLHTALAERVRPVRGSPNRYKMFSRPGVKTLTGLFASVRSILAKETPSPPPPPPPRVDIRSMDDAAFAKFCKEEFAVEAPSSSSSSPPPPPPPPGLSRKRRRRLVRTFVQSDEVTAAVEAGNVERLAFLVDQAHDCMGNSTKVKELRERAAARHKWLATAAAEETARKAEVAKEARAVEAAARREVLQKARVASAQTCIDALLVRGGGSLREKKTATDKAINLAASLGADRRLIQRLRARKRTVADVADRLAHIRHALMEGHASRRVDADMDAAAATLQTLAALVPPVTTAAGALMGLRRTWNEKVVGSHSPPTSPIMKLKPFNDDVVLGADGHSGLLLTASAFDWNFEHFAGARRPNLGSLPLALLNTRS